MKSNNQRHDFFMKIKKWVYYIRISHFYQFFGVELAAKMREKESLEYGKMPNQALKTQKLPGSLGRLWTKAIIGSFYLYNFTCQQLLTSEAGTTLTKSWICTCTPTPQIGLLPLGIQDLPLTFI